MTDPVSTEHSGGHQRQTPLKIDVVSIQSQVIYGSVGNNIAVPALGSLGLAVAAVPTAVLSNTPHYASVHGGSLPEDWFEGYLADLLERDALTHLRGVLTGYLGTPSKVTALSRWLIDVRTKLPALSVVVDPVLGDHDHGEYVCAGMAEAYRKYLLAQADVLTPNDFELALLTGLETGNLDLVVAAAKTLLHGRTKWVVVTSAAPLDCPSDEVQTVLVNRSDAEVVRHEKLDIGPKGTGDLFAAALTGNWLNGASLWKAAKSACDLALDALVHTRAKGSVELVVPVPEHIGAGAAQRRTIRSFTYAMQREQHKNAA